MPLKILDLRPDRALLDPDFNGYKLCLDQIPTLKEELSVPVFTALPSTDQYSYLNAKLFSTHNHLIGDPFETTGAVYFVNENFEVHKAYIDALSNQIQIIKVWSVLNTPTRKDGDYNFSLFFASEQFAVLSDGTGYIYLLDTGNRMNDETWSCSFSDQILEPTKRFIIQDIICKKDYVHCLLLYIDQDGTSKKNIAVLNWATLSKAHNNTWGYITFRELRSKGDTLYSYLAPDCDAIYCVSTSPFQFSIDSENPITPTTKVNPSKCFRWMQTSDTVKLKFDLLENYVQEHILVDIKDNEIDVSYQNEIFLKGQFIYEVDVSSSKWNVTADMLEIFLKKKTLDLTWPEVVVGDNNGKYITTQTFSSDQNKPEDLSDAEDTTKHSEFGSTFNTQQIEECDLEDEDVLINFERLCVKTHEVTHRAHFGANTVLMTVKLVENIPPAMVVRNDVDGCIWQPLVEGGEFTLKHEATLFAFGYIQASKQQKKFAACAPDLSYSVICESKRHIFIYQQNKPINNAELRHRASGKRFGTVAQQHVISIPGDDILGMYAANSTLFLLTENSIVALRL